STIVVIPNPNQNPNQCLFLPAYPKPHRSINDQNFEECISKKCLAQVPVDGFKVSFWQVNNALYFFCVQIKGNTTYKLFADV
ncbi:12410_t:CDS:2, partial [Cetraspora pellucida]